MTAPAAQLSLDGADRLVARLADRRAPLGMAEAASSLFALRGAPPSALVHQLVDEVVRSDHRLVWRSPTEVALAEWEEVATLYDLALEQAPFVVFDLETTGTRPGVSRIVEIGAVRLQGFEQVGEFERLVDPGVPVPSTITRITGIQTRDLRGAPRIARSLPQFLEFAEGAVLVAHNARFDIGFLKMAAKLQGIEWPRHTVLDTVHLARQLVPRDEARNHKLSTLAALFGATTTPDHRALHDARATVDVLHALIGRVGSLGVHTLEELTSYTSRVSPAQRRKRWLADGLPDAPGVYMFKDGDGRVLYVGTSVNIRTRVRSYFTASEHRTRMAEMVRLAESVTPVVCATTLEAEVRELRLIAEHKPRYNRRSKTPERATWVKLTVEAFPRLSIVREVRPDGARYIGPFGSRSSAEAAVAAVHEVIPLRQCVQRLSPTRRVGSCALADMGRCGAPCTGAQSVADYGRVVQDAEHALVGDSRSVVQALRARMGTLAAQERYEDAGTLRDRLLALVRGMARAQRIAPLAASPAVIRHSRRKSAKSNR